jgi:lysine-specific demethylase 3
MASMNGLNDSHRRTSISQLLNPLASSHEQSSFANPTLPPGISPSIGSPQDGTSTFQVTYNNNSSFHLRAASWEQSSNNQSGSKRKADGGQRLFCPVAFSHQSGHFKDSGQRSVRNRVDVPPGYVEGGVWPSQEIAYGASVLSSMYSDERTGLSLASFFLYPLVTSLLFAVAISGDYSQSSS